jgi:predicted DNA-binding ribbon-helix-helix protein
MTIEEMRNSMLKANVYTKADIDKICELEQQYRKECKEIAEQTEVTMNSVVQKLVNIMMSK